MNQESKETYLAKIESQFEQWDADLQILQAKADKAEADAKVKYLEKIKELKQKRSELQQKAQQVKDSADDAWQALKDGLESSWNDLKSGLKNALDSLQE